MNNINEEEIPWTVVSRGKPTLLKKSTTTSSNLRPHYGNEGLISTKIENSKLQLQQHRSNKQDKPFTLTKSSKKNSRRQSSATDNKDTKLQETTRNSPYNDYQSNTSNHISQTESKAKHILPPFNTPFTFWCNFPKCSLEYTPLTSQIATIQHLKDIHNIIISNPEIVKPFLDVYLDRWAKKIVSDNRNLDIHTNSKNVNSSRIHRELGKKGDDFDSNLRKELQQRKLHDMLRLQGREREIGSITPRKCLFCKTLCENRPELFKHMFNEHSFNIGLPDNLIYIDEFLNILETSMSNLRCIYCEEVFRDAIVLKKHMKKKGHFKINPKNAVYDRFYLVNYLEGCGKEYENDPDEAINSEDDDGEWNDWNDDANEVTMCLFDETIHPSAEIACDHMNLEHGFDFASLKKDHKLTYYQLVRLINFIRRQSSLGTCFACSNTYSSIEELCQHMTAENHFTQIPDSNHSLWRDPNYLFPTYDNDPLLIGFEGIFDEEDEEEEDEEVIQSTKNKDINSSETKVIVIPEKSVVTTIDSNLLQNLSLEGIKETKAPILSASRNQIN